MAETVRRTSRIAVLALLAMTALAVGAETGKPSNKAIKCWHNKDGVRECGNAVPPEYAQESSEIKDKHGVTIGTTERAKTQEELDVERAADKQNADAALVEKERAARDRVLLDTFASQDDLLLSRDGQISHLDSQIHLTRTHIDKLHKNLDQSIERAAESERKGEKPSKELVDNIDSVRGQITENEKFIDTKHKEQEEILARFADDITRFRELKGLPAGPIPPPVAPSEPAEPPKAKHKAKGAAKAAK